MDGRSEPDTHVLLIRSKTDLAAAEALYRSLAPSLLCWFRQRVADAEVARDLLGETFAQLIVGVDRYRGADESAACGWIWGIARNLLRRYYRRQRVESSARRKLGVSEIDGGDPAGEWNEVDLAVGTQLHAALDGLPPATRDCVWLRLVDELSYEEIASRAGCSTPTARQRVSRGLRHLSIAMAGGR